MAWRTKKAALERLAAAHPYRDLSGVGMWGHSGGGFMTAAAMLQYPHFYKAGWSESGNHDNNVYNSTWSEKYQGVREEKQKDGTEKFVYEIDKNSEIAKNLTGHLMLATGDMDDNVSMVNAMRLANALIKANKRFEMLVFTGMRQKLHAYPELRHPGAGGLFQQVVAGQLGHGSGHHRARKGETSDAEQEVQTVGQERGKATPKGLDRHQKEVEGPGREPTRHRKRRGATWPFVQV